MTDQLLLDKIKRGLIPGSENDTYEDIKKRYKAEKERQQEITGTVPEPSVQQTEYQRVHDFIKQHHPGYEPSWTPDGRSYQSSEPSRYDVLAGKTLAPLPSPKPNSTLEELPANSENFFTDMDAQIAAVKQRENLKLLEQEMITHPEDFRDVKISLKEEKPIDVSQMTDEEKLALFMSVAERDDENNDDPDLENRKRNRRICNKNPVYTLASDGVSIKKICFLCGDYRDCSNCRKLYYERKIEKKLARASFNSQANGELYFTVIEEENMEALLKQINRHKQLYMRIPQSDNKLLIIHTDEEMENEKLTEYNCGEYFFREAQIDFEQVLKDIPERKKISSSRFLSDKEDDEDEDEDKEQRVKIQQWVIDIPEKINGRKMQLALGEAVKETQGISVMTVKELERATFSRITAWANALDISENNISYRFTAIPISELDDWNQNKSNGVEFLDLSDLEPDVHIRRIQNDNTSNSDISPIDTKNITDKERLHLFMSVAND